MIGFDDWAHFQAEAAKLFKETHPEGPPIWKTAISRAEARF